ncbi:GNAT family N-acetyltransferase [bacterium]|nr:GNAT family N-acetyltransferase [bacterium]
MKLLKGLDIRKLNKDDAEVLKEFFSSLSPSTIRLFSFNPLPLDHAFLFAQRDDITCFIATIDGRIVGYVWWEPNSSPMPTLGICVRDEYQGNGIGKALLGRLIEEARRQNKRGLRLTVMKENKIAISLYLGAGFKPVAEYVDNRGPSLIMKLELD